jgi:hypothetical protein
MSTVVSLSDERYRNIVVATDETCERTLRRYLPKLSATNDENAV